MDWKDLYDNNNKLKVPLRRSLAENKKVLGILFENCGDVVQKSFAMERAEGMVYMHVVYIDGLTDNGMIEETILKPLSYEWRGNSAKDVWDSILYQEVQTADIKEETSFDKTVGSILKGDTAIFIDGYAKTMIVSSKKLPLRGISENDTEAGMRGPKDSFNEGFRQSTALIRRRIKDAKLRVEQDTIGERTRTDYALVYLADVASEELVKRVREDMHRYDIDAIYDSGMAQHLMENWYSPFPTFQSTTRPDKVAAGITEGRVAIVFDNSPEVILAPCNLNMLLQTSDDYYNRWAVGTFARIIRYIAAFLAVSLPGLYIAITVYHSDILPTKLLYAIASARSMVTFPVIVEVLLMEFLFELLREAGIRLPGPLGNTIGIVGGLIVGQSAVEAGIVSTMVVIVVALTAIASFAIPNEEFASVFRLLKFFVIIPSAIWGLYGYILALLVIVVHLSGLMSFGIPYMYPIVAGNGKRAYANQDFVLRAPISWMRKRPIFAREEERMRLKPHVTKSHATNGFSRPAAEQSEGAIPGLKPHVTKSAGEEEKIMNLADGKISKRQWFRMSYLECVTISMMMIPYITLSLAGKYHVLALVVGLAFVVFYGALMLYLADFVPCGYINAIRNHMGWTAGILDVLYALRYLLRATLIAVFFSMILQRYLLQSFSVWWIFLPFLGITLYGASKSMEGRGRMFEFLFGWMVVPLILIVVFSVSNIDIGAIMQGITSQSEVSGVFKGAYAILLALSPLELQLYSRPCVKEKDRTGGIWLLVWILFTIVFAYLFIVAILGYGWTASDTTASFNVMEAASFPGGAVARLDYPVMAFWIIGVFAVVSGYLHQTRDFLYSLCEVKHKCGRVVTFVVMFAVACLFAYGMQFESAVKYGMRYFLYADLAIGIVFPLIVMWVKTKKRVKWGIGFVCLTVLAAIGSVLIGDERLGRQFVQNDFTAIEQKKETLEHRDYVQEMQVETAKDGYQFTFVIADIAGYEGENSIKQTLYHVQADSLAMAAELYQRENERQLDFGHIKQIAADMTGQEIHPLLLELGHRTGISKSVPVVMESDGAKYILREMIKAAYGRESL